MVQSLLTWSGAGVRACVRARMGACTKSDHRTLIMDEWSCENVLFFSFLFVCSCSRSSLALNK